MVRPLALAALMAVISLPLAVQAMAQEQRNLSAEEANRKLVVQFYDQFFNKHDVAHAAEVISEDYIQHNPDVPDGKKPFVDYFTNF